MKRYNKLPLLITSLIACGALSLSSGVAANAWHGNINSVNNTATSNAPTYYHVAAHGAYISSAPQHQHQANVDCPYGDFTQVQAQTQAQTQTQVQTQAQPQVSTQPATTAPAPSQTQPQQQAQPTQQTQAYYGAQHHAETYQPNNYSYGRNHGGSHHSTYSNRANCVRCANYEDCPYHNS